MSFITDMTRSFSHICFPRSNAFHGESCVWCQLQRRRPFVETEDCGAIPSNECQVSSQRRPEYPAGSDFLITKRDIIKRVLLLSVGSNHVVVDTTQHVLEHKFNFQVKSLIHPVFITRACIEEGLNWLTKDLNQVNQHHNVLWFIFVGAGTSEALQVGPRSYMSMQFLYKKLIRKIPSLSSLTMILDNGFPITMGLDIIYRVRENHMYKFIDRINGNLAVASNVILLSASCKRRGFLLESIMYLIAKHRLRISFESLVLGLAAENSILMVPTLETNHVLPEKTYVALETMATGLETTTEQT